MFRHNEFAVNILEGSISGENTVGRPRLQYCENERKQILSRKTAHCATSRKVAGLICNGVIGIFINIILPAVGVDSGTNINK
jgi:hypothetical protein